MHDNVYKKAINYFHNDEFGTIRTITDRNGEVYFVGKDVAKALGYAKPENALAIHVSQEDKTTTQIQGIGSNYKSKAVLINEPGVYSLIFGSRLSTAKAFKHWVISEVLPQIRRTGGYIPTKDAITGEKLSDQQIIRQAEQIMRKTIESDNMIADGCITATEMAKVLGIEFRELNRILMDEGIIFWNGSRYKLNKDFADLGLAQDRNFHYYSLDGEKKQRSYLVWTPTGMEFVRQIIEGNN